MYKRFVDQICGEIYIGKIVIRRVIEEDLPYVVDIQIDGWRT